MMAKEEAENLNDLENLSIKNDNKNLIVEISVENDCDKYGLPLKEVYKLAYNFYKGNYFTENLPGKNLLFRERRQSCSLQL